VTAPGGEEAARAEAASLVAELRRARVSGGYPQRRLADALGVGEATVRSWESGRRIPTLINLIRSGRELGLRLVIVGRDGQVRSARVPVKAGELWADREIRSLTSALRGERRRNEMSQDAVAEKVGVSLWSIAQFEQGRLHPRPAVLAAWAAALDCGVRWRALV
jgi:transcriptional regulator with XRE-family HTH domain